MCPIVPMFTCGFVRSYFAFAIATSRSPCRGGYLRGVLRLENRWSPCPGLNRRPRPYQGRALPSELHGPVPRTWSGKRDSNPRPPAWKAGALPLSYSRKTPHSSKWWGGEDLNPRRRLPADLQSAPFGHLGTSPNPPACMRILPKLPKTLALAGGFEPPTHCLQGSCSATELRQHRQNFTLVSCC